MEGLPRKLKVSSISSELKNGQDKMSIDGVLKELGLFGWYQAWVMVLLCLPNILGAMYSLSYVFTADSVPYRCAVPECEQYPYEDFTADWVVSAMPNDTQCSRYQVVDTNVSSGCGPASFNMGQLQACEEFVYGSDDTIVAEFSLGCAEWKRTLVGTVRNIAVVFALLITGFISDTFGRKIAFCIFSFFAATMGILKSFSISYIMYLIVEFFEGSLGYGFNSAGYVMVIELAHPSMRVILTSMTGLAYGLGGVLFGLIAYQVPYWRYLLRTIYIPGLVFLLYILILDESPRWLYTKGRVKRAGRIIKKAAKINKVFLSEAALKHLGLKSPKQDIYKKIENIHTTVPPDLIPPGDLTNTCHPKTDVEASQEQKNLETDDCKIDSPSKNLNAYLDLLKSKTLVIRMSIVSFCWIVSTFVYYGLTINSVSLSGNKYINFSLGSLMEIIASIFIMMSLDRFGRKKSIIVAFIICGVACFVPNFFSGYATELLTFLIGKLAITFAFNSVYVLTGELFPTDVRSSALAACSLAGRVGSILAPQTPLLSLYMPMLPSIVFSVAALLAGVALLFVPETRHSALPDTARQAAHLQPQTTSL